MVQLVIKISEDVYTRLFDNGIQDNEIAIDDICEMARALRMGIPLEEEFEKIYEEAGAVELTTPKISKGYECYGIKDKTAEEMRTESEKLKGENTQKSEPDDFYEYWDEMAISDLP